MAQNEAAEALMDGDQSDLLTEFQKLRQETEGISKNLRRRSTSIDARGSSNVELLKTINGHFNSIRADIEDIKAKQNDQFIELKQNQEQMKREILGELRSIGTVLAEIKKTQKEESDMIDWINTKTNNIEEGLKNPVIGNLCDHWLKKFSYPNYSILDANSLIFLNSKQWFHSEGNTLTWSYSKKKSWIVKAESKIGVEDCKVAEDETIEFRIRQGLFKLKVENDELTISHGDVSVTYCRTCA